MTNAGHELFFLDLRQCYHCQHWQRQRRSHEQSAKQNYTKVGFLPTLRVRMPLAFVSAHSSATDANHAHLYPSQLWFQDQAHDFTFTSWKCLRTTNQPMPAVVQFSPSWPPAFPQCQRLSLACCLCPLQERHSPQHLCPFPYQCS